MQDKFLNLSKKMQLLIVIITWVITVVSFAGCHLVKHYHSIMWVELVLTCLGMFFSIVAICLTIGMFTKPEDKDK